MASKHLSRYRNDGTAAVRIEAGTKPGAPPDVFEAGPGEEFVGPTAYANFFARKAGVVKVADIEPTPEPRRAPRVVAPKPAAAETPPVAKAEPKAPAAPKASKAKSKGKAKAKAEPKVESPTPEPVEVEVEIEVQAEEPAGVVIGEPSPPKE
jgi:hypothetical protein